MKTFNGGAEGAKVSNLAHTGTPAASNTAMSRGCPTTKMASAELIGVMFSGLLVSAYTTTMGESGSVSLSIDTINANWCHKVYMR